MARVLCVGSINIDDVFSVPHIVASGETLGRFVVATKSRGIADFKSLPDSTHYAVSPGGKGANQSVALAKAGAKTFHASRVGTDGVWVKETMEKAGVDVRLVEVSETERTGRAIIQHSTSTSDNAIVLFPGSNHSITAEWAARDVFGSDTSTVHWERGDWLVMQNEISNGGEVMKLASDRGFRIAFNPAPFTASVLLTFPLECVDLLVFNEIEYFGFLQALSKVSTGLEGAAPSDVDSLVDGLLSQLDESLQARWIEATLRRAPRCALCVVTLGPRGAVAVFRTASSPGFTLFGQSALPGAQLVDTTGAGDTFVGFLVAQLAAAVASTSGSSSLRVSEEVARKVVARAAVAAGLTCERAGAMSSIPTWREVEERGKT